MEENMNLTLILEVAIGIVFIWMVLSIATMQIQEWVMTLTKKRSKDLEAAIRKMLAEPSSGEFLERFKLADYFYDHPIIRGLTAQEGKKPSYIPARQFATVLFDIAMTAGTEASYIQQGLYSLRQDLDKVKDKNDRNALQNNLNQLIETARTIASSKAGSETIKELLNKLKTDIQQFSNEDGQNKYPEIAQAAGTVLTQAEKLYNDFLAQNTPPQNAGNSLDQIRSGLVALSAISPEVSRTMEALLLKVEDYATNTEKSIAIARTNVENWFDSSMDRLGGVFKRYAQWWALGIGVILALILNVDSIALTQHLWREPTARQVLVENAEDFKFDENVAAQDPQKAMQDFNNKLSGLDLPIGWSVNPLEETFNNCRFWPATNEQYFGIRWFGEKQCLNPSTPDNSTNFAVKLIGILISGFATMQGAPYWFDILKKLVNVRGTGTKPEEKKT